jgi:Tfp pilus assembly protein PilF
VMARPTHARAERSLFVAPRPCYRRRAPVICSALMLLLVTSAIAAAPKDRLAAAIAAYENLDDQRARALLTELVSEKPGDGIVARAFLYLGLIDFNDLDSTKARREFERALELDPAVEPPLSSSPKARMLFAEARQAVSRELDTSAASPAPPAATAAVHAEPAREPPRHGHALAWGLGAGGLVSGGVAVYGLTEVLSYNSLANQANAKQGAIGSAQIAGQLSNAKVWQPLSIALGAVGVGLLLAAALTW